MTTTAKPHAPPQTKPPANPRAPGPPPTCPASRDAGDLPARAGRWVGVMVAVLAAAAPAPGRGLRADDAAQTAFFRKKIEPVLKARCYKCHSQGADELKGGLRVDTRRGMREGGESGPAVVPENVSESLLITALQYDDDFYQMPPDAKLPEAVIADFIEWISKGAADPRE